MTRRVPRPNASTSRDRLVSCALGPLERLLDDLGYPALRWQIVATAELAGADTATLWHLAELPDGEYVSLDHIRHVLAATG